MVRTTAAPSPSRLFNGCIYFPIPLSFFGEVSSILDHSRLHANNTTAAITSKNLWALIRNIGSEAKIHNTITWIYDIEIRRLKIPF